MPLTADARSQISAALTRLQESHEDSGRLLLGPGPSPVSPRVMQAMASPVISHLDPAMMAMLDDLRQRLAWAVRRRRRRVQPGGVGDGYPGMEAAVANVTRPGMRALVVVSGYFGDRLAQILERYGAAVSRVQVEWGRACDPDQVARALSTGGADIVAMVQAETSTGVVNPIEEILALARTHGACPSSMPSLAWCDPASRGAGRPTSLQLHAERARRAIGARADDVFRPRARGACAVAQFLSRSVALEDYWLRRKYHHTISAPLCSRCTKHSPPRRKRGWRRGGSAIAGITSRSPPASTRSASRSSRRNRTSVDAQRRRVPDGVDEAPRAPLSARRVRDRDRRRARTAGGRIWRVGLMGSGSTLAKFFSF